MSALSLYLGNITPMGVKPTSVSKGKKNEGGKTTVFIPRATKLERKSLIEAATVAEVIKITQVAQIGDADAKNTVFVTGKDAASVLSAMFGTESVVS